MSGSSKAMLQVMAPLLGCMLCFSVAVIDVVVRRSWPTARAVGIEGPRAELRVLDEDAFLAAVHAMPALADSASPSWKQEASWDNADHLLAAADVFGERGWVTAVVPVFERVARGTCTRPCSRFVMVRSGPLGPLRLPRCWSVGQSSPRWHLSVVGVGVGDLAAVVQPRPRIDALDDGHEQVRVEARRSLEMLAQVDPDAADVVAGLPELR
jgi:hypothetical protein